MRRDLVLHFLAGLLICGLVAYLTEPTLGFAAAMAAGIGKEIWDATGRGTPDKLDVLATVAGGVFAAFVVWAV